MRSRLLIPLALLIVATLVMASAPMAWAADTGGENTFVGVQASGGQLTVRAGVTYWTPPTRSVWATRASGGPPPGKPDPNQPYGCTYTAAPSLSASLGAGGAQPGEWMVVECAGPGAIDPMPPVWVSGATPPTVQVAQVDPVVVAEQAVQHLGLGSPMIEMAPPDGSAQLVGVASWLWLASSSWQTLSASASAGPVTVTATAVPSKVVWDMGDGQSVTCDGPGTAYVASDPGATSDCSYTWPGPGSFMVTATIYWSVSWTAAGAPGGGNLGVQAGPAADVAVTVSESQAINTPTGGSY